MKRHLVLAAPALFTVIALPASAQYWGAAGSTGIVDEASAGLYEVTGGSLQFKSGQTGTIVARYPVGGHAVLDPAYQWMVSSHAGPGVTNPQFHHVQLQQW